MPNQLKTKLPLLCRLRLHSWTVDSAMFSHAAQCSRCLIYKNSKDQERLELERKLWEAEPAGNFAASAASVNRQLHSNVK